VGPEDLGEALRAALGGAADVEVGVSGGGAWARATVDVPVALWPDALRAARDDLGCDFFDWLSAVDELDDGYSVVAHVWSTARRHGALVRTRVPRAAAAVASVVALYPGAAWHERETHEMFGVDFPGHPGLTPLLLPPEFEGHPLRKDFVLATRVAKPWPGEKEPGESHVDRTARRQPMRPPGVPDPAEWGPDREAAAARAAEAPARPPRAARPATGPPPPDGSGD
jgi:NADH-quinone oxidoreductase subunit C